MAKVTVNESGVFTDVVRLDHNDLKEIGNGGTRIIAQIPAHGAVELVGIAKTVAVSGTTTLVLDVGTTLADPDEFINGLDADAMTNPVFNTGDQYTAGTATNTSGLSQAVKQGASAQDVYIKVTDAAIASITAGEFVIGLRIIDLAKFS
jgi:hypothetical protein